MSAHRVARLLAACVGMTACARAPANVDIMPTSEVLPGPPAADLGVGGITQLVVVTTASWDTTGGTLRRYERRAEGEAWHPVGTPVPVVVGRTGLAWDDGSSWAGLPGAPVKHEGDGRAPAGLFPLDTVFGFRPATEMAWVRLPYVPLTTASECVDDVASVHYNTIVDRGTVGMVDWKSAEHMRAIDQYRLGVTVRYNPYPTLRAGRGSCIFLHVWAGPGTYTAGCTAMAEHDLAELVLWMDRARRPALAQLPEADYARLRSRWGLP